MPLKIYFILSLFFIVINTYVLYRLFPYWKINFTSGVLKIILPIAWGLFLPLPFLLRMQGLESAFTDLLFWMSYILLGIQSLLILFLVLRDLLLSVEYIANKIFSIFHAKEKALLPFDSARRKFIYQSSSLGLTGGSLLWAGIGIVQARTLPAVKDQIIYLPNLPKKMNGMTLVQISDIHIGPTLKGDFLQELVHKVNLLNPEYTLITGDLVDGSVSYLQKDVSPLKDLNQNMGNLFVTGNHEYYSDALSWIEFLKSLRLKVLLNESVFVNPEDDIRLCIGGVTDYSAGHHIAEHVSNPYLTFQYTRKDDLKILLAHQPKSILDAANSGAHLQISGHTHGGQYLPFQYFADIANPYLMGHYHHNELTQIYVNPGTGYWGPPHRAGVPSEITRFILKSE